MRSEMAEEARDEFLAAIDWYDEARQGLGAEFVAEVESAIATIEDNPTFYAELDDGIRRCLVNRFPYALLYSIEPDRVLILAVMHTSRRPGYWRNRLDNI